MSAEIIPFPLIKDLQVKLLACTISDVIESMRATGSSDLEIAFDILDWLIEEQVDFTPAYSSPATVIAIKW